MHLPTELSPGTGISAALQTPRQQAAPRPALSPRLREYLLFAPVYFVLALINLRVKLLLTPAWNDGRLVSNHEALIRFAYANNEQSRLLQFLIPECLRTWLHVSIPDAYLIQRWLFMFLTFEFFHVFLRKWFPRSGAFAGVAFMAAMLPLTYFNQLQESAPLLSLTFLLCLWSIRAGADLLFCLTMFVGALNNETVLILSLAYLAVNLHSGRGNLIRVGLRTALLSAPGWLAVGVIRYITRDSPRLCQWWTLDFNLHFMRADLSRSPLRLYESTFLYVFLVFGAFWVYAFLGWSSKDRFLRRASVIIPPFLVIHMITGIISEVRLMVPLSFLIIPMAMQYLCPPEPADPPPASASGAP